MKKHKLLPILAFTGITKNKELYLPYIGAGVFSAFLYFTFDSILSHPVMGTLPRAAYAYALILIGFGLLHIIILPFLHYTYRFLIKRRKKELGLYSILGMEKKHIAVMMVYEGAVSTFLMVFAGVLTGMVFSRLIFLLLFYMQGLPVLREFPFSVRALRDTIVFFSVSALCNLIYTFYAIGKSNPIELLSSGRKGEKKPKHIMFFALSGLLILAAGYAMSITAKLDSSIFGNFFFAVFLVIIGTYFVFTSGSVMALGFLRKRKHFYYQPSNFITVSGIYYRMKRNAAGLVNICIFSTMVIITLSCTVALFAGTKDIIAFQCPDDIHWVQTSDDLEADRLSVEQFIREIEKEYAVEEETLAVYPVRTARVHIENNSLVSAEGLGVWESGVHDLEVVSVEEYNRITGENKTLDGQEIMFYSNGRDFDHRTILIFGEEYSVKEELSWFPGSYKARENIFSQNYWIVVRDFEALPQDFQEILSEERLTVALSVSGEEEEKEAFASALKESSSDWLEWRNNVENKLDMRAMCGGLLFIGIFFGLLFTICLLIIMYYKQITEGYEDRDNFEIMQKVGMSHEEIRSTIAKQVLMVFFLPLFGAVCHTMAAIPMTSLLLSAISLFNRQLIVMSCTGVLFVFLIFYGISYLLTAKTYMRIVERR